MTTSNYDPLLRVSEQEPSAAPRGCYDVSTNPYTFECARCATILTITDNDEEPTVWIDGKASMPNFCPGCGEPVLPANTSEASQDLASFNPMQHYRHWSLSSVDSYIAQMFDPEPFTFPPVLWNPAAGLLLTMYKNLDTDLLPEVKMALSITPAVVQAKYLASYQRAKTTAANALLNSSSEGEFHFYGYGEYLQRTQANEEKLAEQVRSAICTAARIGRWYEFCEAED